MKRLLVVLLAGSALGMAVPAAQGTPVGVPDPLVVRFTGVPGFVPPTSVCPEGTVVISGVTVPGGVPAQAQLCLISVRPLWTFATVLLSDATLQLAGIPGEFHATVVIREVFQGPVARRSINGVILGGTGTFTGARGNVSGGGTIVFGQGPPRPDLVLTFDFA
jgi:hypothetical protein